MHVSQGNLAFHWMKLHFRFVWSEGKIVGLKSNLNLYEKTEKSN